MPSSNQQIILSSQCPVCALVILDKHLKYINNDRKICADCFKTLVKNDPELQLKQQQSMMALNADIDETALQLNVQKVQSQFVAYNS